jgi:hypothetical protein
MFASFLSESGVLSRKMGFGTEYITREAGQEDAAESGSEGSRFLGSLRAIEG